MIRLSTRISILLLCLWWLFGSLTFLLFSSKFSFWLFFRTFALLYTGFIAFAHKLLLCLFFKLAFCSSHVSSAQSRTASKLFCIQNQDKFCWFIFHKDFCFISFYTFDTSKCLIILYLVEDEDFHFASTALQHFSRIESLFATLDFCRLLYVILYVILYKIVQVHFQLRRFAMKIYIQKQVLNRYNTWDFVFVINQLSIIYLLKCILLID